ATRHPRRARGRRRRHRWRQDRAGPAAVRRGDGRGRPHQPRRSRRRVLVPSSAAAGGVDPRAGSAHVQGVVVTPEPKVCVVAGAAQFAEFMDVTAEDLERTFRTNVLSLLHLGQAVVPRMLARGGGAMVVTGNTSAWRGTANFAAFAPSKAAQRILAQSMARSLGPKGIHVAYVVIDAVIDVPWTRQAFASKPDEFFAQPAAIAETVYHVAHQDRSAWTFEVDLRPFGEKW